METDLEFVHKLEHDTENCSFIVTYGFTSRPKCVERWSVQRVICTHSTHQPGQGIVVYEYVPF